MKPVDDYEVQDIVRRRHEQRGAKKERKGRTESDIYEMCKELIFDIDDKPVFHAIMHSINTEPVFEIEVSHLLDILVKGKDQEDLKEDIKHVLALAIVHDVPVYPNNERLASVLAKYHRDLLIEGFRAPDESGEYVRLQLANSPGPDVETLRHFESMRLTDAHSPAELQLIRDAVMAELAKRDEAGRILTSLRLAIEELSALLEQTTRNEGDLQECLTRNPILFGTEYRRVVPKHRLGTEYEMDYALEHATGLVDLVEIEASTHRLFTKKGDPRQALIHAEQQVLDWLDWLERHGMYARENLPGLVQPVGYVVIGRSIDLSEEDRKRLRRRNSFFRGNIRILTYDDLLGRARNLLGVLEGGHTVPVV